MNLIEYADREMMMIDLANVLAGELNGALMTHDTVSFAVPGGTTPGPLFDTLCGVDLDWGRVHVLLTDERCVPAGSDRSNEGLLRRRLFVERAAKARYLPILPGEGEGDRPGQQIDAHLPLSVALLGMGDDMHTASLFPGDPDLAAALDPHAPVALFMQPPGAPEPRVSLSARVLNGAMSKHIVIIGAAKRAALDRALSLRDPVQAPVCAILGDTTIHWAE